MKGKAADELTAEIAEGRPLIEVWRATTGSSTYTLEFQRVR